MWAFVIPFLLCLVSVRLWTKLVEQSADSNCKLPLPPGSFGLPFIGESLELAWRGHPFFQERRSVFGKIYKTHLMGRPTIMVCGFNNIKKILKSEEVNVSAQWPQSAKMLIGQSSLMAASGEIHHMRRQCVLSAATTPVISELFPTIQEVIRKHLSKWVTQNAILGESESRYLATGLATQCLLGYTYNNREVYQIAEAMSTIEQSFFTFPCNLPGSALHKAMESREVVGKLLDKSIEYQKVRETGSSVLKAMLQNRGPNQLTMGEVKDVSMEMVFCAIQGMSKAICTLLLELARHHHVTEKACQELFHLNLLETQTVGDLTVNKMADLTFIKRIVKEVLRMAPPIGNGYRHVLRTMDIDGYQIPKGWAILYSIRDQQKSGTSCEKFDPDRWLPHRDVTKVDQYMYTPFGGPGQRSCVGESFAVSCLEIFTAESIRNCQWNLMESNPAMKYFSTVEALDGLPLVVSEAPPFRQRRITL